MGDTPGRLPLAECVQEGHEPSWIRRASGCRHLAGRSRTMALRHLGTGPAAHTRETSIALRAGRLGRALRTSGAGARAGTAHPAVGTTGTPSGSLPSASHRPCSTTPIAVAATESRLPRSRTSMSAVRCCSLPRCCTTPGLSAPVAGVDFTLTSARIALEVTGTVGLSTAATETMRTAITLHHTQRDPRRRTRGVPAVGDRGRRRAAGPCLLPAPFRRVRPRHPAHAYSD